MPQANLSTYVFQLSLQDNFTSVSQRVRDEMRKLGKEFTILHQQVEKGKVIFRGVATEPGYRAEIFTRKVGGKEVPAYRFREIATGRFAPESVYKEHATAIANLTKQTQNLNKAKQNLIANFAKLGARAVAVIPIWMALRNVYMELINVIREGVRHIVEFDKALARAEVVTRGVGGNVQGFMKGLREEIQQLALDTGRRVSEIAEAYYRFGTAGRNAIEAQEGMKIALKTSIAMMGDTVQTARAIADIYNVLGDRIEGATTVQEKMQMIGATMATLWRRNAFELGELIQGLKNFASTAANLNLTFDQTMTLLAVSHTLMQRAGTSGTQLTRVFLQMMKNIERVEVLLGRAVNLETENAFDVFLEVLKAINTQFEGASKKARVVADIFGIRGARNVQAFTKNIRLLISELERLQGMPLAERLKELNKLYQRQADTIDFQINRFRQLRRVIGETFVKEITGTEDYTKALQKINDFLETKLIPTIKGLTLSIKGATAAITLFAFGKHWEVLKGKVALLGKIGLIAYGVYEIGRIKDAYDKLIESLKGLKEAYDDLAKAQTRLMEQQWVEAHVIKAPPEEFIKERLKVPYEPGTYEFTKWIVEHKEEVKKLYKEWENINKIQEQRRKIEQALKFTLEERVRLLRILSVYGYSELEIEKAKLALYEKEGSLDEQRKQRLKVIETEIRELTKYAQQLQSAFSDAFTSLIKGETGLTDALQKIAETWRNTLIRAFSEGLTEQIFKITGIGAIFGKQAINLRHLFSSPIENAHLSGILKGVPYIVQAHQQGMQGTITTGGGIQTGVGRFGALGDLWQMFTYSRGGPKPTYLNIPGIGGGTYYAQSPGRQVATIKQGGREIPVFYGETIQGQAAKSKLGQAVGKGLTAAMAMYSLYQLSQARGGNVIGGAIEGGMAGYMLGGPIGAVIGAIYGGVMSARPKTTETWNEYTKQVTSRIDVTNKQLQIVNRNLLALKNVIETYMLPESAYFSTKVNIEDQFSLNARRGG
ncbi:MAG: phage tail tape measure protein [Candidatus Heimdallarchaeaceae archaeon]